MKKEHSALQNAERNFDIFMSAVIVITVCLVWLTIKTWRLSLETLLPFGIIAAIWWTIPSIFRNFATSTGGPASSSKIPHESIGTILFCDMASDGNWLILWQPERVNVATMQLKTVGDAQYFRYEQGNMEKMPEVGTRVIVLVYAGVITLRKHPLPEKLVTVEAPPAPTAQKHPGTAVTA